MRIPADLSEMQGTVIPELISIRPAGKPPQDFLTTDKCKSIDHKNGNEFIKSNIIKRSFEQTILVDRIIKYSSQKPSALLLRG